MSNCQDLRLSSPSALRNRDPILAILSKALPAAGCVLEVASGTGEHITHFAQNVPHLLWQPSDPSPDACSSIAAWREAEGLANVLAPMTIDAGDPVWPPIEADAIICINMIHISPWAATVGLMRQAGQILPCDGLLYLYGPYRRGALPLAPSNQDFDLTLRTSNPQWGLRELDEVIACAEMHGLQFQDVIEMPSNNLSVQFRKRYNDPIE